MHILYSSITKNKSCLLMCKVKQKCLCTKKPFPKFVCIIERRARMTAMYLPDIRWEMWWMVLLRRRTHVRDALEQVVLKWTGAPRQLVGPAQRPTVSWTPLAAWFVLCNLIRSIRYDNLCQLINLRKICLLQSVNLF